eukprot:354074-Chlamydomonas_euryale.AAC.3
MSAARWLPGSSSCPAVTSQPPASCLALAILPAARRRPAAGRDERRQVAARVVQQHRRRAELGHRAGVHHRDTVIVEDGIKVMRNLGRHRAQARGRIAWISHSPRFSSSLDSTVEDNVEVVCNPGQNHSTDRVAWISHSPRFGSSLDSTVEDNAEVVCNPGQNHSTDRIAWISQILTFYIPLNTIGGRSGNKNRDLILPLAGGRFAGVLGSAQAPWQAGGCWRECSDPPKLPGRRAAVGGSARIRPSSLAGGRRLAGVLGSAGTQQCQSNDAHNKMDGLGLRLEWAGTGMRCAGTGMRWDGPGSGWGEGQGSITGGSDEQISPPPPPLSWKDNVASAWPLPDDRPFHLRSPNRNHCYKSTPKQIGDALLAPAEPWTLSVAPPTLTALVCTSRGRPPP